ncbi:MAG: glycosyltransferase family 39 protein [Anaerolineales bacterium]
METHSPSASPPAAGSRTGTAGARKAPLLRRRSFQIAVLCLAAFAASAAVALNIFEAMPHLEDEHANYFQAMVFARGAVAAPAPPSKDSFFIPFVIVRDGLWFGKYTPGYPLVLALGVLAGAPWLVNALASALALFGVYLLGRDLFGADTGLLAAALGAVSPAFVILSGSLLPHPVTMAALMFFAWAFVRARPGQDHDGMTLPGRPAGFAVVSGAALGLAVLCRPWTALAVSIPFMGIACFDLIRMLRGRNAGHGRMAMIGRNALRPYLPLGMVCLAVCALLPLYNYLVTGSPFTNTYTLWWPYDTVGFGPGVGVNGSHTLLLGMFNALKDLIAFQTAFTGWPVSFGIPLAALVLILGLILAPRSRADLLLLLPPLALIAAHLAYWARAGEFYGGRYYSEGMPFLWLLAARGLLKLCSGKWRLLAVRAALPVILAWGIFFQILPRFVRGHGLYGISRENIAASGISGLHDSLVFITIKSWKDYANFSWMNSPFLDSDVVFARDMGEDRNIRIIETLPGREVYYYTPGGSLTTADGP